MKPVLREKVEEKNEAQEPGGFRRKFQQIAHDVLGCSRDVQPIGNYVLKDCNATK